MIVGIGVDAVEIARIARALERHARFAERVFTKAERDASARRGVGAAAYLAKRWAAKEAVSKALGVGFSGFRYTDLEVTNHPSGAPSIELNGELADWARELGVTSWHLSLSDTRDTAVAAVVAEGEQRRRPGGPPPWVRRRLARQRAAAADQAERVATGGSPRLDKGVDR
jgi:holo-[acyl-carrier protein] synthase